MFARTNAEQLHLRGVQRFGLKMLVAGALVMTLSNTAFNNQIFGATVKQGSIKVKSGNVRTSASTTADVAFCVKNNDLVAILGEEKGSDGMTWYKILIGESSIGYVRSDLVTSTDNKITVSDSLVSNTTQDSLSTKNQNNTTIANKENTANSNNTTVSNTDDNSGNFSIGLTVGVINSEYVRLRSMASTESSLVKYFNKGDIVIIVGEGKGKDGKIWYQTKSGNELGFVRSDLVNKVNNNLQTDSNINVENNNNTEENTDSEAENKKDNNTITNVIAGSGTVKGMFVRVREQASIASNILGVVNTGDSLPVLGRVDAEGRQWIRTKINHEGSVKDAFIAGEYVSVSQEPVEQKEEVKEDTKKDENIAENKDETEDNKQNEVSNVTEPATGGAASIKGVGVRIRQTPVTGNVMCQLSSGHPLLILGNEEGEDGHVWYNVSFSYLGNVKIGYVRDDYVIVAENIVEDAPMGDEEFEASIASFPGDYKNSLRALHVKHPQWKFEAVDTGLEWSDALTAESSVGKNLVSKNSIASWKSTAPQAYNWKNNSWYTFDGGSWVSASTELIAYYMDPRNFLNDSGIYQFETLGFDESQKKESVSKMLAGTFMSGEFTDTDGTNASYADVFMQVGSMTGVSPYLLAGRCIQEQGIFGKSQSVAGNVPGYEGYYNYFNVGAYAYSGRSATINGLRYAKGTDGENGRPWNSRVRSIYGGALYIADKFLSKGQNTLYFQKFNVVNSENTLFSHQYMSNIQAASSESARIQLAYLGDDEAITFKIPIYRNMPSSCCIKPTSDSSPNTYLATLTVDGQELKPSFTGSTENYTVKVDASVEYISINAAAVSPTSSVGGTGIYQVVPGDNYYRVVCKSQNGSVKTYTILVQR